MEVGVKEVHGNYRKFPVAPQKQGCSNPAKEISVAAATENAEFLGTEPGCIPGMSQVIISNFREEKKKFNQVTFLIKVQ